VRPPHIKEAKQIVSEVFPDARVRDPEIHGGAHHARQHRGPYAHHARQHRLPPLLQNNPAVVGVVLLVVLAALVSGIAVRHNRTKPAKSKKYASDYEENYEDYEEDAEEPDYADYKEPDEPDEPDKPDKPDEPDEPDAEDTLEKKRSGIVATIESALASEKIRDEVLFNSIKSKMPYFKTPAQFSLFLDSIQADAMPMLLEATDDPYYKITSHATEYLREHDLPLLGIVLDLQNDLARSSVIDRYKSQTYARELYIAERDMFEMNKRTNIEELVRTISGNVNAIARPASHDYSWLLGDKALTADFLSYVENNAKIIYNNRAVCDAMQASMAYMIIDSLSNYFTMNARKHHMDPSAADPRRLRHLLILIGVSRYWARMTSC
jgi:hypothetical protein